MFDISDIYFLNQKFDYVYNTDYYKSLIWNTKYCGVGDFELYMPYNDDFLSIVENGFYVCRKSKPSDLMIIDNIQTTNNSEDGNFIILTGKSVDILLNYRIIWNQTNLNGNIIDCVKQIINDNIINPSDQNRRIDFIKFGKFADVNINIDKQYTGTNLLDAIIELLTSYNLGYFVEFKDKNLYFNVVKGNNLTNGNANNLPIVRFSDDFDNIISSEYTNNISNHRNVALVAGEGEGLERKRYSIGDSKGLERKELYVDARDLNQNSDSEEDAIDDNTYYNMLKSRGIEKINEHSISRNFECAIDGSRFGIDYNLGDIVEVKDLGVINYRFISEVIESYDESGYSIIPTFSDLFSIEEIGKVDSSGNSGSGNSIEYTLNEFKQTILDAAYPIGSIYMSVNSTNPSELFGGTWISWGNGKVPVSVDNNDYDFREAEVIGGSKGIQHHSHDIGIHRHYMSHKHDMSHTHYVPGQTISGGSHGHSLYYSSDAVVTGRSARINGGGSSTTSTAVDSSTGSHTHTISSTTTGSMSTSTTDYSTDYTDYNEDNETGYFGEGNSQNLQPYITCYMWKRTA